MRELLRSLPLVVIVLLVPIVPFVLFGGSVEEWFNHWSEQSDDKDLLKDAATIVGLLATDIFLPIPSSMVSTFGGSQLGWWLGTLASWLGMSMGAIAGFALARWFGPTFTRWFVKPTSLEQMRTLSNQYGAAAIVLTRGLPVLAEASVLLLGLQRLSWRKFLPPLLLSNFGLALVYSIFGQVSREWEMTWLALVVSILLPVIVGLVVQRRLSKKPAA